MFYQTWSIATSEARYIRNALFFALADICRNFKAHRPRIVQIEASAHRDKLDDQAYQNNSIYLSDMIIGFHLRKLGALGWLGFLVGTLENCQILWPSPILWSRTETISVSEIMKTGFSFVCQNVHDISYERNSCLPFIMVWLVSLATTWSFNWQRWVNKFKHYMIKTDFPVGTELSDLISFDKIIQTCKWNDSNAFTNGEV